MAAIDRAAVAWRRVLWRRPWIYWSIVVALASATGWSVHRRTEEIDRARERWDSTRQVLVAAGDASAGDRLVTTVRRVPQALVPDRALDPGRATTTYVARHAVADGEILTDLDVGKGGATGPAALVPDGWWAVPVVETPPSGAVVGDRVVVASEGIALTERALVVGHHGDATLVAVPADVAPLVPAAASSATVALLLAP